MSTVDGNIYEIMGQQITLGSMWACSTFPTYDDGLVKMIEAPMNGVDLPVGNPDVRGMLSFVDVGNGIILWDWVVSFIEQYEINPSEIIPSLSTGYENRLVFFFNSDGELVGTTNRNWTTTLGIPNINEETYRNYPEYSYTFAIGIYGNANTLFCVGRQSTGLVASDTWIERLVTFQGRNLSYPGCTTWPTLSDTDRGASCYSIFRLQKTYLPDITNLMTYYNGGGVPENYLCGLMNGIINHDYANSHGYNDGNPTDLSGMMSTADPVLGSGYQQFFVTPHDYNGNIPSEVGEIIAYGPKTCLGGITAEYIPDAWYGSGNTNYAFEFGFVDPSNFPLTLISSWEKDRSGKTRRGGGGPGPINIYGNPQIDSNTPPSLGPSDSGFTHLYSPSPEQMQDLSTYLWTHDIFTMLNRLMNDPMDAMISLSILPINLQPIRGVAEVAWIGNVQCPDVVLYPLTQDWIPFDFGDLPISEVFKTALDYSPYTKVSVYLPFIGYVDLNPGDVQAPNGELGSIGVQYMVNLFTGDCVAKIYGKGVWGEKTLIGTYSGNCAFQIPFTSGNYSAFYKNVVSGIASTTMAALGGGGLATAGALVNSALSVASSGAQIQRSGALTGGSSTITYLNPHIVKTVPIHSFPDKYEEISGFPANYYSDFKDCAGFTQVEDLNMDGFTGTDAEAEELKRLLKEGVIFKWNRND